MHRHKRYGEVLGFAVMAVLFVVSPALGEAQEAKSKLSQVTLYRDQAQITRQVVVPAGVGSIELVVSGLPSEIEPSSLFAEGGEAIDVRAVRFRQRVIGQEPRDDIRALDEKIAAKQIELAEVEQFMWLVKKQFDYLEKLEAFAAPVATGDLSTGKLDAAQLRETTQFVFEQRAAATREKLDLDAKQRIINRDLQTLQEQRNLIAGKSQTTVREAVLFLDRHDANADAVRLTYLVGNCGWSPSYNVRGDIEKGAVRVEYNALIRQVTGEDWDQVELTLSTASPMISASGPAIASFPVMLQQLNQGGRAVNGYMGKDSSGKILPGGKSQVSLDFEGIINKQTELNYRFNRNDNLDDNLNLSWSNNVLANQRQLLELCEPVDKLLGVEGMAISQEHGLSISYPIQGLVSLQSRSDQQMTRIMQSDLKGTYYHVANPVLTEFVYREAEIVNASGRDMLAGPVSVYLDGRFVGRTDMVSVTRGQTFILGFGADPQLTASRQLVEREQGTQGGNTRVSFSYRMSIENFGDKPAMVRLLDRLPHFNGSSREVKLTLDSGFEDLSTDPVYLRLSRPSGILRWDITVDAGATGEKAAVVPYRYSIEFDRNFGLASETDDRAKEQFKLDAYDQRKY